MLSVRRRSGFVCMSCWLDEWRLSADAIGGGGRRSYRLPVCLSEYRFRRVCERVAFGRSVRNLRALLDAWLLKVGRDGGWY